MAEVFNWHLNRTMQYPYEEARPERQFSMIMDPNKCIACQTCTVACKQAWTWGKGQEYEFWNNVESKPYGSYPVGWDVKSLSLLGDQTWEGDTYTGKTVFESAPQGEIVAGWRPDSEEWAYPNLGEDEPSGMVERGTYLGELPQAIWMFYLQRICNHCTYPACLAACPRKAIYKRPEDGIVLVDQERCRGYRECMKACPYKKILFNNTTRVSEKCIACFPYLEKEEMNRCVIACIGRIRLSGYLSQPDAADPSRPIDFLVHERKVVRPLYPQFGTEPNVYYFPPINVPLDFLEQMFGPGAEHAVEGYKAAMRGDDPELRGLLMLFGATDKVIHRFEVVDDVATGYGVDGVAVASVPVREPVYIRPFRDDASGAVRANIT